MPPAHLPLRDAMASLRLRADAGDSLAACRLGVELLRCAYLGLYPESHDAFMATQEADEEAKGNFSGANRIAMGRLGHAQLREACAGVPDTLVSQANRYLRQAALAGEPEAMIRYAAGEPLVIGAGSMNHFTTPEFDVWRQEARPVLMRALRSGSPEATLLLAEAHAGNSILLAMLLPRDALEASASRALVRRLFGENPPLERLAPAAGSITTPALDDDQAAAAEQLAAEWHARGFQGRKLVIEDSTAALLPLYRWMDREADSKDWPGSPRPVSCDGSGKVTP